METKEFDAIINCVCGTIHFGYYADDPGICEKCGRKMSKHSISGLPKPPVSETYDKLVEFSKDKHTIDEWYGQFSNIAWTHGHNTTMQYKLYIKLLKNGYIPADIQLPLILEIYTEYETDEKIMNYVKKAYKAEPKEQAAQRMATIKAQLADLIDAEEKITIYRGVSVYKGNDPANTSLALNKAVSFTTDYDKAIWFAQRLPSAKAIVYTAKIPLADVVFYSDERNEKEVVFIPKKGKTEDYIIDTKDVGQNPCYTK